MLSAAPPNKKASAAAPKAVANQSIDLYKKTQQLLVLAINTIQDPKILAAIIECMVVFDWETQLILFGGIRYQPSTTIPNDEAGMNGLVTFYEATAIHPMLAAKKSRWQWPDLKEWENEETVWNTFYKDKPAHLFFHLTPDRNNALLVMPCLGNMSLMTALENADTTEKEIRVYIAYAKAVRQLQTKNIAHNNMKPSNIRISDLADDKQIFPIDFGWVARGNNFKNDVTELLADMELESPALRNEIFNPALLEKLKKLCESNHRDALAIILVRLQVKLAEITSSKSERESLLNEILAMPNLNQLDPEIHAAAEKLKQPHIQLTTK